MVEKFPSGWGSKGVGRALATIGPLSPALLFISVAHCRVLEVYFVRRFGRNDSCVGGALIHTIDVQFAGSTSLVCLIGVPHWTIRTGLHSG